VATPGTDNAQQLVGQTLRRKWRVDALIGVGGMANVYRATHRNGRKVAVKVLNRLYADNPEVCERFLREGYVANKIDHPGVVNILDDDTLEDGSVFLVMELLQGESLAERLEKWRQIVPVEALFIADQVLDALAAAHAEKVIHRDIKPGNVFLLKDGRVKVLDFGLARVLESQQQVMTRDGLVLGTLAYMSPEQAKAKRNQIDARSDLFSVGAMLFYALSGRFVHDEPNQMDRLMAAMRKPARSLATVTEGLPSGLVALIDKALAFAPDDRWQTAVQMRQAVQQLFEELTGHPIPATSKINVKGAAGWVRPASAALQRDGSTEVSEGMLDVTVVFEPEDEASLSIPIEVDSTDGSIVVPVDVEIPGAKDADLSITELQELTDSDFDD
jgi:serine/threonine protein kinase